MTTPTGTNAAAPKTIPPLAADLDAGLRRLKLAAVGVQGSGRGSRQIQCRHQRGLAVRGTEREQDLQLGAEAGVADRGSADQERLRVRVPGGRFVALLFGGPGCRRSLNGRGRVRAAGLPVLISVQKPSVVAELTSDDPVGEGRDV